MSAFQMTLTKANNRVFAELQHLQREFTTANRTKLEHRHLDTSGYNSLHSLRVEAATATSGSAQPSYVSRGCTTLGPGEAVQRRKREFIDRRQVGRIISAINHAHLVGRPLNTAVTINFGHTDWTDLDALSERWARSFLKEFNRWLRKTWPASAPGAFVWGIEHPENDHPHVHWSVHIPTAGRRSFEQWVRSRVRTVFGEFDHRAIWIVYPPTPGDQVRAAKYSAKATKRAVHKHYRLSKSWERQGFITGKRCGHSQSLGLAAIARHAMKTAA